MPASALSVSWVASASVRADLAEVSAGGVDLSAGVEAVSSQPRRDLSAPSSHVEGTQRPVWSRSAAMSQNQLSC